MKTKKLLLCMLSIVALASCGGRATTSVIGGGGKIGITEPWWTTEGELRFDDEGNPIFEDVYIDLATVVSGEDVAPFQTIVNQFNSEYTGKIQINVETVSDTVYEDTVGKRIANNSTPPDLLMSHQKGHRNFADLKLIQPFDEVVEKSNSDFDIANYIDKLGDDSDLGFDNVQFQIPIDAASSVILYNKKLLNQIGETKLPESRSEFIEVCKKVSQLGSEYVPFAFGTNQDFFFRFTFPTAFIQNGGELYNPDTYRLEWTNERNMQAWKDATKAFTEFYDEGIARNGANNSEMQTKFREGKALFHITMPWSISSEMQAFAAANSIQNIDVVSRDWLGGYSIAKLFALDENAPEAEYIVGDSHSFVLSKSVTDITEKAAALEFAQWFTENGSAGVAWAEAGHISASHTIINDDEYRNNEFVQNYINEFYFDINNFQTLGNNPHYSDLMISFQALGVNALKDPSKVEQFVKEYQDAYNGILDLENL